jgi:hypothetical protein
MPHMVMEHSIDPATSLLDQLGDVRDIEVFHNQALIAVYLRPQKTASGIYLTDQTRNEDIYQSKIGLLIKTGDTAFVEGDGWWSNIDPVSPGNWLVFRPSESWSITVNGVICRIIDDINVRGRVSHPDMVW